MAKLPGPRRRILPSTPARLAAAILLAALVLAAPAASASERVVIGHVEGLHGPSNDYELHRGGAALPLGILSELESGDRIVVLSDDGEVRLRLTTDEVVTVRRRDSPYTVEPGGAPPSWRSNLLRLVTGLLTEWHDWEQFEVNLGARTGPMPLALPLLPREDGAVSAGRRLFALTWFGGQPPFALELRRLADDQLVLAATDLPTPELSPRELDLVPGDHRLVLRDASGRTFERTFAVVARGDLPAPAADPALAAAPEPVRRTATAAWLAGQEDGRWLLEAYLESTALADAFEPARLLGTLLAESGLAALP